MKRTNLYITALLLSIISVGCVREPLKQRPQVELSVSWINSRQAGTHSGATFYLYPQFEYSAEPLEISAPNGISPITELLPGRYRVMVVNSPSDPVRIDGRGEYSKFGAYLELAGDYLPNISQFMALDKDDAKHEIEVAIGASNKFVFTPISVSRKIRFLIKGDKFGVINVVDAQLSGITSRVNLSTFAKSESSKVKIDSWKVEGTKFTSDPVEVLGFNYEDQPIVLTLFVTNPSVTFPLEQPVDITSQIKAMRGDEIEITMEIDYDPDLRIRPVSIREWDKGNELEIGIN